MIIVAMKSIEWTFTKRPLRRYELPEGRDSPVERPLSVSNVLIDAFDLLCNQQGIGWSWSPNPFLRETTGIPVPTTADRFDLGQHVFENYGGRCLTIYHADDLSVHRQARRGEHL